ncbi:MULTISPECIES: serine hydrolase [unclassified Frondihabitans]|uniref:serine hydrolase n=1 Tax=unclassified Frondihabitans TaxID=2626248 RepID=UPI000F4F0C47|nr:MULTISPECIES: serine hydrolase [unclassified Frondihabitans]RPE77729.1 beta-lactamase class A [Frondihabitans sp. PhB153]RPF08007.1 beta-lactamase class A [Frondihabitans sp. PhB161]
MAGEGGAERSRRARDADPGRHRTERSGSSAHARLNGAEHRSAPFERSFRALGSLAFANARVSAAAADLDTGETLLAIDETVALPTADVGRLLLLVEVAAQLGAGRIAPLDQVAREAGRDAGGGVDDPRAGGLWSSLLLPSLGVIDAATLVGAVRDPVATNGLIRLVGFDAIRARGESLGLRRTALLDYTRATRGPDDAPQSSVGSTAELQQLFGDLVAGRCVDRGASNRVLGWLSAGSDLSLVASAFGLDPVAHRASDHGLQLVNITGVDRGVRSEAGALRGSHRGVSYAVTVEFDDADLETRLGVLDVFRTVGLDLLERVS